MTIEIKRKEIEILRKEKANYEKAMAQNCKINSSSNCADTTAAHNACD